MRTTNFAQAVDRSFVTGVTAKSKRRVYKRHCMSRERRYSVYLLASKSRTPYVGVTGALLFRVLRHKAGEGGVSLASIASSGSCGTRPSNRLGTRLRGKPRSKHGGAKRKSH